MNRFVLFITFLLAVIAFAGCYTQIGYYEPRPSVREISSHHQDERRHQDEDEKMDSEREAEEEVEATEEPSEMGDEGYYGRRKPGYSYSDRYYRSYSYDYYDYHPVYPYYYGGYHPLYPYYGYSYYPYHSYYGPYRYYGGYRYRPYRYGYSTPRSKIGNLNFGKRRSQSYRGVRSSQPSSRRPGKSLMKDEESKTPARSSSESRRDRSRRSRRR